MAVHSKQVFKSWPQQLLGIAIAIANILHLLCCYQACGWEVVPGCLPINNSSSPGGCNFWLDGIKREMKWILSSVVDVWLQIIMFKFLSWTASAGCRLLPAAWRLLTDRWCHLAGVVAWLGTFSLFVCRVVHAIKSFFLCLLSRTVEHWWNVEEAGIVAEVLR